MGNALSSSLLIAFHRVWIRGRRVLGYTPKTTFRSYDTPVDRYFQSHSKSLPLPSTIHQVIPPPIHPNQTKVLVIGDVHGCIDELESLVQHARSVLPEGDALFRAVVLVGDMVNKGPDSLGVLRLIQQKAQHESEPWFCIRGNHDNAVLEVALDHDSPKRQKQKYHWLSSVDEAISDHDIIFLSELPYTLTIPWMTRANETGKGVRIVHAGLVPGISLQDQDIYDMITLRDVVDLGDHQYMSTTSLVNKDKRTTISRPNLPVVQDVSSAETYSRIPWAHLWKGPETIVFGHDAKRGLQKHYRSDDPPDNPSLHDFSAIGLDTGAVYGNRLTGIILPDCIFVSVPSKITYSPIK